MMFDHRDIAPLDPIKLVSRLEQLLGVKLYPTTKNDLRYVFDQRRKNLLSIEDIQYYDVRVKTISIVRYADGMSNFLGFLFLFSYIESFSISFERNDSKIFFH